MHQHHTRHFARTGGNRRPGQGQGARQLEAIGTQRHFPFRQLHGIGRRDSRSRIRRGCRNQPKRVQTAVRIESQQETEAVTLELQLATVYRHACRALRLPVPLRLQLAKGPFGLLKGVVEHSRCQLGTQLRAECRMNAITSPGDKPFIDALLACPVGTLRIACARSCQAKQQEKAKR